MLRWLDLLAGPLIWAMHFGVVYAIASVSIQMTGGLTSEFRITIAAVSVILIAAVGLIAFWPRHKADRGGFLDTVRISGAVVAIIGIVWQTLPIMVR